MNNEEKLSAKKNRIIALISSIAFMLAAHLYRWMNLMFSHDSLAVFQGDDKVQYAAGRFIIPLWTAIRGKLSAPYLIAIFGGAFLVLSAVLIVHILRLQKTSAIILCTGLLVTFESITYTNAIFIFAFDEYMLSLLMAVLSAYYICSCKKVYRYPLAIICAVISLGLYQSFVEVIIVLIMLVLIRNLLENESAKNTLKTAVIAVVLLIVAGIVYYIVLRIVLSASGATLVDGYNGLGQILNIPNLNIPALIWRTWKRGFEYLLSQEIAHRTVTAVINIILLCAALAGTVWLAIRKKLKAGSIVLLVIIMLLLPFAGNSTFFLANGFKHSLMIYSFAFYAVWFLMIYDMFMDTAKIIARPAKILCAIVSVLCGILILNHIVFANQLYLKKHLEAEAGLAFMNRVVMRIEETDGYQLGKTKVAILGEVAEGPISMERPGFDIEQDLFVGTMHHLSVSYYRSYYFYFNNIMGYPIKLTPVSKLQELIDNKEVQAMPIYPAEGSVKMIGDTVVVRMSEDLRPEELKYNIN